MDRGIALLARPIDSHRATDGDLALDVGQVSFLGTTIAVPWAQDADLEREQRQAAAIKGTDPPELGSKATLNAVDLRRSSRRLRHAGWDEDRGGGVSRSARELTIAGRHRKDVGPVGLNGDVTAAAAALFQLSRARHVRGLDDAQRRVCTARHQLRLAAGRCILRRVDEERLQGLAAAEGGCEELQAYYVDVAPVTTARGHPVVSPGIAAVMPARQQPGP
mmetsp:Transcript_4378/g.11290  ORF Transcript_4378/g.11290 Transcript_4378/m.11290 type:complete len:220 (-) Transcript_4378:15-674(-)